MCELVQLLVSAALLGCMSHPNLVVWEVEIELGVVLGRPVHPASSHFFHLDLSWTLRGFLVM